MRSRFYVEDRQVASGEWKVADDGVIYQPWQGTWFEKTSDSSRGELFLRTYDSGQLMEDRPIAAAHSLYEIVDHL